MTKRKRFFYWQVICLKRVEELKNSVQQSKQKGSFSVCSSPPHLSAFILESLNYASMNKFVHFKKVQISIECKRTCNLELNLHIYYEMTFDADFSQNQFNFRKNWKKKKNYKSEKWKLSVADVPFDFFCFIIPPRKNSFAY